MNFNYTGLSSEPNSANTLGFSHPFFSVDSPTPSPKTPPTFHQHTYRRLNEQPPSPPRSPLNSIPNSPVSTARKTNGAALSRLSAKRPAPLGSPNQTQSPKTPPAPHSAKTEPLSPDSPASADDKSPEPILRIATERVKQIQQTVISFNGRRYRVSYDSTQQLPQDTFSQFCLEHLQAALNLADTEDKKAIFTKPFTLSNTDTGVLVCPEEEANAQMAAQLAPRLEIVIPNEQRPQHYKGEQAQIWRLFVATDTQDLQAFNTQRIKEAEAATKQTNSSNTQTNGETQRNTQPRVVFKKVKSTPSTNKQTPTNALKKPNHSTEQRQNIKLTEPAPTATKPTPKLTAPPSSKTTSSATARNPLKQHIPPASSAPLKNPYPKVNFSTLVDKTKVSKCSLETNPSRNTMTLNLGDAQIVLAMHNDITTQETDFLVNAANELMLGGSGVDGAITKKGGPELALFRELVPEVRKNVRCPTGEARLTDGGRLPASFCIHTVGPQFDSQTPQESRKLLLSAYTNSLTTAHACTHFFISQNFGFLPALKDQPPSMKLAGLDPTLRQNAEKLEKAHRDKLTQKLQNNEPLSISFPTISTGIYGYPAEDGAAASLEAVLRYLQDNQGKPGIKKVQFVFRGNQKDVPYYTQALQDIHHALTT